MQLDPEQVSRWQSSANNVVSTLQGYLAPYDPLIYRWVSPYISLPGMPDGLLTALSVPVGLAALVLVATVFDMFGTLLLRITFGYEKRKPFHPAMWRFYDGINKQLSPQYRLIPWMTLYDLVEFNNGSKRQCIQQRQKLLALHVDAVIVDKATGWPLQVVMLALPTRASRSAKQRYRRIAKACKRAGLPIHAASIATNGEESVVQGLEAFVVDRGDEIPRTHTTQDEPQQQKPKRSQPNITLSSLSVLFSSIKKALKKGFKKI